MNFDPDASNEILNSKNYPKLAWMIFTSENDAA
jgi:hypothetical protein